jgi:hypothetical protein
MTKDDGALEVQGDGSKIPSSVEHTGMATVGVEPKKALGRIVLLIGGIRKPWV